MIASIWLMKMMESKAPDCDVQTRIGVQEYCNKCLVSLPEDRYCFLVLYLYGSKGVKAHVKVKRGRRILRKPQIFASRIATIYQKRRETIRHGIQK